MSTPIITEESAEQAPLKGVYLDDDQLANINGNTVMVEKKPKTEADALKEEKIEPGDADPAEEKNPPVVEAEDEPEDIIELEDPGQFTPQDYSFEVTVYDEEGKKPKTVKIDSIDKWEEVLADDPNLGSSLAVNKAFRLAQKMESGLESDRKQYETDKANYDKAAADQAQSEAMTQTWANEIAYLEGNGSLPKVPAKFKNVSWIGASADKEALADDSVKAQIDLLEFMRKENIKRRKLGLSDLGPEGAFNARQLNVKNKQVNDNKVRADQARKQAGSMIAGSSPNPVTVAPKGISVGVGGSLRDLSNRAW